jgi:hypothetical protein
MNSSCATMARHPAPGDIPHRHGGLHRLGYDGHFFCAAVKRRWRATPLITSTFENVSDIGVPGLSLARSCGLKPLAGSNGEQFAR